MDKTRQRQLDREKILLFLTYVILSYAAVFINFAE